MNDESEGFRRATMKMLRVQLNSINVMDLVAFGGAAAGIAVAVLQLASGAIGFSGAFLVVFLSQEFSLPMRRLGSLFHTVMNGMSAAKTMFRILDAPVPPRGERELDGCSDIVCRGVGYSYGEGGANGGLDMEPAEGGAHIADRKVASGIRHPGCGAGRFPVRRRTPAHRPCAHLLA